MKFPEPADPRSPVDAHRQNLVPGLLLGSLVWRIVVVNALAALPQGSAVGWIRLLAEAPVYAAIALLVRSTIGSWRRFHIDTLSIVIFLTFGTLFRTSTEGSAAAAGLADALVYLGISAFLVLSLRGAGIISWARARDRAAWIPAVSMGCISASAAVVVPGAIALLARSADPRLFAALAIRYSLEFFRAMGHAAILEEPIFRGFLWGWLKDRGWADNKIWLLQTGLFCLAHLPRYWHKPQVLLISLPAGGLVLGWLAWKTRSVAPSMVAHGIYNALAGTIQALAAAL